MTVNQFNPNPMPAPEPTLQLAPAPFVQLAPAPLAPPSLPPAPWTAPPPVTDDHEPRVEAAEPAPTVYENQPAEPEPDFEVDYEADNETVEETARDPSAEATESAEPQPRSRRDVRRDPAPRPPGGKTRDRERERDRALIRKTAAKFQELLTLPEAELGLLAAILGSAPKAADVTVAILTASAKDYQPATDALAILDADLVEAAVEAAALGRTRVKGIWTLVAHLGYLSSDIPASDAKAAVALVRGMHAGDGTSALRERIESAVTAIKR